MRTWCLHKCDHGVGKIDSQLTHKLCEGLRQFLPVLESRGLLGAFVELDTVNKSLQKESSASKTGHNWRKGVHIFLFHSNIRDCKLLTPLLKVLDHLIYCTNEHMRRLRDLLCVQPQAIGYLLDHLLPLVGHLNDEDTDMQF